MLRNFVPGLDAALFLGAAECLLTIHLGSRESDYGWMCFLGAVLGGAVTVIEFTFLMFQFAARIPVGPADTSPLGFALGQALALGLGMALVRTQASWERYVPRRRSYGYAGQGAVGDGGPQADRQSGAAAEGSAASDGQV